MTWALQWEGENKANISLPHRAVKEGWGRCCSAANPGGFAGWTLSLPRDVTWW